jgi:hypothetical protein
MRLPYSDQKLIGKARPQAPENRVRELPDAQRAPKDHLAILQSHRMLLRKQLLQLEAPSGHTAHRINNTER